MFFKTEFNISECMGEGGGGGGGDTAIGCGGLK